jgi:NAD+ synthase
MAGGGFSPDVLRIDAEKEIERIGRSMRTLLSGQLKRRGLVVGLSGGIDSSVTAALSVRGIGKGRVFGLHMPERQSADETLGLSQRVADTLGIESQEEDITTLLHAVRFYERYEECVRQVIPEYGDGWASKIVTPDISEESGYTVFSLVARSPEGEIVKKRLGLEPYLGIVAATNFKQRTRKMLEYYHADRLNYAVAGTPNRLEYDQGFFVKLGDGAADLKPIAHLYKTQVYQLAEALGIPKEIRSRPPTTDTYSLPQGQDEFYFSLPHDKMDLCLYGKNHDVPCVVVADVVGLTTDQVERVYKDIETKRSTTRYLHLRGLLTGEVPEIPS